VGSAQVLGPLPAWRDGLEEAGLELGGDRPELVVATAELAAEALALSPAALLLEGRVSAGDLRKAGYEVQRLVRLRDVLLPLGQRSAARYAFSRYLAPATRPKRARNRAVAELAGAGRRAPGLARITLAVRKPGPPFLLRAARALGAPAQAEYFLSLGGGDALSRAVFHLFEPREKLPSHVLKFTRVPGYSARLERDERGLRLAAQAGPVVAERAAKLLGRFAEEGLEASLETAVAGERLSSFLTSSRTRAHKLETVERVCAWLIDVARATAAAPDRLDGFRRRLEGETLPYWRPHGAPPDLLARLAPVPAVFLRGDLWSENVLVEGARFGVVDWEDAEEHGPPLWDLVYFLTDALAYLDAVGSDAERDEHSRRLWRGELPSSQVLFAWTRRYLDVLALPAEAVGPLVTALWLAVGAAHAEHAERAEGTGVDRVPAHRFARIWLDDPDLGPGWDRWR
jgi:hypothetical protein